MSLSGLTPRINGTNVRIVRDKVGTVKCSLLPIATAYFESYTKHNAAHVIP